MDGGIAALDAIFIFVGELPHLASGRLQLANRQPVRNRRSE
jgi:hypothetical protein